MRPIYIDGNVVIPYMIRMSHRIVINKDKDIMSVTYLIFISNNAQINGNKVVTIT